MTLLSTIWNTVCDFGHWLNGTDVCAIDAHQATRVRARAERERYRVLV